MNNKMAPFTWEDIYNEAELLRATLKLYTKPLYTPRKGFIKSQDDINLYDFAVDTPKHLNKLHKLLSKQTFTFRAGVVRKIEVNGKVKSLYIYPWQEKIVDAVLYYTLTQKFGNFFSNQSFAYKPSGSGVDMCQHRIKKYLNQFDTVYLIKRDISSFFPSINHEVLWEKIEDNISDPFILDLLHQRVKFKYIDDDKNEAVSAVGVPFGTPIACFLANLYLDSVDKVFENDPEVGYFRYADDFLIATPNREKALKIVQQFQEEVVDKLKVTCKPSHSRNLILTKNKTEDAVFEHVTKIKHLGLEYRADHSVGLSRDKVRKILNLTKKKLKHNQRFYKKLELEEKTEKLVELANEVITEGVKSVAIIDYYLKHITDEKQLKLIDRYVAETILSVATGRGYKKSNFKIIPYSKLRELGLISLVHRRRLINHGQVETSFFLLRNQAREERLLKRREKRKERINKYREQKLKDRTNVPDDHQKGQPETIRDSNDLS